MLAVCGKCSYLAYCYTFRKRNTKTRILVQNLVYTFLNGGEGVCLVCTCWLYRAFQILDKTAEDIDQQYLPRNQSCAKYCGCLYKKEPASEICGNSILQSNRGINTGPVTPLISSKS